MSSKSFNGDAFVPIHGGYSRIHTTTTASDVFSKPLKKIPFWNKISKKKNQKYTSSEVMASNTEVPLHQVREGNV
jgi:hypothetical protein